MKKQNDSMKAVLDAMHTVGTATNLNDGAATPPAEGGETTPPAEGGETPPAEGGETPPAGGETTPPAAEDGVIVREPVTPAPASNDGTESTELILDMVGETPANGDTVTTAEGGVVDGVYKYEMDGVTQYMTVEDGIVTDVADDISDEMKKKVIGGKPVKVKVPNKKRRMSPKQKAALAKNRKKANTGAAKKKRNKSFAKGKAMGMHNETVVAGTHDVSTVDLTQLGDDLHFQVLSSLVDRYGLTEEQTDSADIVLTEAGVCTPVVDGSKVTFTVPIWVESITDGVASIDVEKFDLADFSYELDGMFDQSTLLTALTTESNKFQDALFI